ncbi:MAG: PLDc N-terminal domain-containing protein, partial [Bacteroidales bacterium]|nr:PLDc N-terminal domain-containing protein [Bacteroidales bacterium]
MPIWLRILFGFLLVSVIVILIAQNRHPVKTLAWILLLFFLPVIGLVLYFFLGINKSRERLVSEEKLNQLKQKTLETAGESVVHDEIPEDNETANLLRMINNSYVTSGNDVRFYTAFDPMEADLLEDIRNAKHHIHFQ